MSPEVKASTASPSMLPLETVEVLEVVKAMRNRLTFIVVDGVSVDVSSERLLTFKLSRRCHKCGLEGNAFIVEKCEDCTEPKPGLNLYHIDPETFERTLICTEPNPRIKKGNTALHLNRVPVCQKCKDGECPGI